MVMIPFVTSGSSQVTVIAVELISLTNKSPGMPGAIEQLSYLCYKVLYRHEVMSNYRKTVIKHVKFSYMSKRDSC